MIYITSYQGFILIVNISICTKLHIFAQFESSNKTVYLFKQG